MNIPLCLICGKSPHDERCTYVLDPKTVSETLSDNEREMFQERAAIWLENPSLVQTFLNLTALVTLQKLAKDALIPGGKDPATTSIRAITELVKKNADWMDALKQDKQEEKNPGKNTRSKVL